VLDTLAFAIWNIGTRGPFTVVRDVLRGLRHPRAILLGLASALVGAIFVTAATILLLPAIVLPEIDFLPAELFTLLVALALEHFVGDDLRGLAGTRPADREGP